MYKKIAVMVIEGFGIKDSEFGNVVNETSMPVYSKILEKYPSTIIYTSGKNVGLSEEQVGTSSVSYGNIGAGRIIKSNLLKINNEIENGDFFQNENLKKIYDEVKEGGNSIHLVGLLSDGGVHSSIRHLSAFLELAKRKDISNVYIHVILDGVDTELRDASKYIAELEEIIATKEVGNISTIIGRKYAMDCTGDYRNTKIAYDALMYNKGILKTDYIREIEEQYMQDRYDRNIHPIICTDIKNKPIAEMRDDDAVIFFNFRQDRMKQLVSAFKDPYFDKFETSNMNLNLVTMTEYLDSKNTTCIYEQEELEDTFIDFVKDKNIRLVKIYDKIKEENLERILYCNKKKNIFDYCDITYENKLEDEENKTEEKEKKYNIKSVITSNLKEKEYLENIRRNIINNANICKYEISKKEDDIYFIDFSNLDVIGHFGEYNLAKQALEAMDEAIGIIKEECEKQGVTLIITSTHGNIEEMIDKETGTINTKNTNNPVPFIVLSENINKINSGNISDIVPTIINIMGLKQPEGMTGKSLISR